MFQLFLRSKSPTQLRIERLSKWKSSPVFRVTLTHHSFFLPQFILKPSWSEILCLFDQFLSILPILLHLPWFLLASFLRYSPEKYNSQWSENLINSTDMVLGFCIWLTNWLDTWIYCAENSFLSLKIFTFKTNKQKRCQKPFTEALGIYNKRDEDIKRIRHVNFTNCSI